MCIDLTTQNLHRVIALHAWTYAVLQWIDQPMRVATAAALGSWLALVPLLLRRRRLAA